MDAKVRSFIDQSGFKVLALARLSQCGYSLVFYLLNCAVSKLDQFITNEPELASLIGYDEQTVRETLEELDTKNIVRLHYGDHNSTGDNASLRIGLQYDLSKWVLAYDNEATSKDAVVFPFRRQGAAAKFSVVEGQKKDEKVRRKSEPTWKRVLESYVKDRSLDDDELEQGENAARILVETHPVDQVLLMLRHFGHRIPTLSLLASSWQHYQEIFEVETQKVDMLGARQKHLELDRKVRDHATELLHSRTELSEEERTVLQILIKHRHPRRQLFWAYQLRSRYPNLDSFFADNASLMLPVTSGGIIIKKPLQ